MEKYEDIETIAEYWVEKALLQINDLKKRECYKNILEYCGDDNKSYDLSDVYRDILSIFNNMLNTNKSTTLRYAIIYIKSYLSKIEYDEVDGLLENKTFLTNKKYIMNMAPRRFKDKYCIEKDELLRLVCTFKYKCKEIVGNIIELMDINIKETEVSKQIEIITKLLESLGKYKNDGTYKKYLFPFLEKLKIAKSQLLIDKFYIDNPQCDYPQYDFSTK